LPAFIRVARRLAELALLLAVLSVVVFTLLYLVPGDPARALVGARPASPELLAQIRAEYHLDDPWWVQYLRWITGVLHGDLGTSIRTGLPVTHMLAGRAEVSLQLAGLAGLLAVAIGLPAGIMAARAHGRGIDRAINAAAVAGVSAPSYAIGLLGLYVFAVWLGWFPVYGLGNGGVLDRLWHLVLPVTTLAAGVIASIIKVTRASMIREVNADYSSFARSRGIAETSIIGSQLSNAALPIATSTGLVLASLVGGTVLVETTFALGGLGSLLAESVTFKDIPVVQAITLLMAVVICSVSAVVDAAAGLLDPRLRTRRTRTIAASTANLLGVRR
jgi:peptide/nickel transport system permease protein